MQLKKFKDNDYPSSEASDFEGFNERVVGRDYSSDEDNGMLEVNQEVFGIHSSDSSEDENSEDSAAEDDEKSLVSEEELLENFMKFNKNAAGKSGGKRESESEDEHDREDEEEDGDGKGIHFESGLHGHVI